MPDVHSLVRAWLVQFKHLAHLHNIVSNLAAAVMYYINVNRIAHLFKKTLLLVEK